MTIRVGYQKSGITPEDHRHYASLAVPPTTAVATASGLTSTGGDLVSTGAMTATIAAFRAIVQGTSSALQGAYPFVNDSTTAVTITDGHATLPRQDLIVAQVRDNPYDSSGFQDGRIYVVVGTANVSPVAPAVPANAIPLWEVRVTAGANAGNGGVVWGSALTDRRITVGWAAVTTGAWTAYTPTWAASGGGASLGNGTILGRWHRVGQLVSARVGLVLGSTSAQGSGYWTLSLPLPAAVASVGQAGLGHAMATDAGNSIYQGIGFVGTAASTMSAFSNNEGSPWGPTRPFTWGTGDTITMLATYEAA